MIKNMVMAKTTLSPILVMWGNRTGRARYEVIILKNLVHMLIPKNPTVRCLGPRNDPAWRVV